jgi:hypothetical protein
MDQPRFPILHRLSGLQWFVLIVGVLVIASLTAGSISDRWAQEKKVADDANTLANLTGYAKDDAAAWASLLADPSQGKINDPYSFQQHCGQPALRVSRPKYFALVYSEHNLTVMFISRKLGTVKQELARGSDFHAFEDKAFFNQISPEHLVDTESALKALGCTVLPKS